MAAPKVTNEAVERAMEVGKNSAGAANYLSDQFSKIIAKAKVADAGLKSIGEQLKTFAEYITFQFAENGAIWLGQQRPSAFKNAQAGLAASGINFLQDSQQEENKEVYAYYYAIKDDGSILRQWVAEQTMAPNANSGVVPASGRGG